MSIVWSVDQIKHGRLERFADAGRRLDEEPEDDYALSRCDCKKEMPCQSAVLACCSAAYVFCEVGQSGEDLAIIRQQRNSYLPRYVFLQLNITFSRCKLPCNKPRYRQRARKIRDHNMRATRGHIVDPPRNSNSDRVDVTSKHLVST